MLDPTDPKFTGYHTTINLDGTKSTWFKATPMSDWVKITNTPKLSGVKTDERS